MDIHDYEKKKKDAISILETLDGYYHVNVRTIDHGYLVELDHVSIIFDNKHQVVSAEAVVY